jgi:hypothetical protein
MKLVMLYFALVVSLSWAKIINIEHIYDWWYEPPTTHFS